MSEHITLKDVEMAIKVLEEYLKHVHKARSVLQKYYSISGHGYRRPEDIVAEIIAKDMAARAAGGLAHAKTEPEQSETIDIDVEKAVERLRQLAESEKAGEKKKTSTGKQSS